MSSRFGRLFQKINVIQSFIIYNGNILHDPLSKPANVEYSSTLIFIIFSISYQKSFKIIQYSVVYQLL